MGCEASKLWRTGFFFFLFSFLEIFHGPLPTVKTWKIQWKVWGLWVCPPPIFCLKGKKNVVYLVSVFLSSVEERTQIMKTYSLVWLAWLLRYIKSSALQFSFQTSEVLPFFYLTRLVHLLVITSQGALGQNKDPFISPTTAGVCNCVAALPLTKMDYDVMVKGRSVSLIYEWLVGLNR